MKYLRANQLAPGLVTACGLYNAENRLMLAANTILTDTLVSRIRALNFHGVYVLHEPDDTAYAPLLDDEARQNAIKTLKSLDIDQIRYVANNITNQVLYGADRLYDMMTVSAYDDLTYMHSVNVTILSVMLGVAMGLVNDRLIELGQAALLHDIGKTRIDPNIIKKPGRLTDDEYAQIRNHPQYGYDMLADNNSVPELVRLSVLSHHENEDGTGYPYGLKSPSIPVYAKIIHVADVYDAMVSKRSYKDRLNPADVLEYIMAHTGSQFDLKCVTALQNSVALYPDGVKVKLSDGIEAYVQENTPGFPSRPVVLTDTGMLINLMTRLNITVEAIIEG